MDKPVSPVRWLIVGGCPRSGTTLLNFMLNSHPAIFVANEHNLNRSFQASEAMFRREDDVRARQQRALSPREKVVGVPTEERVMSYTITRAKSQRVLFESLFQSSIPDKAKDDVCYIGDKFPRYYEWDIAPLEKALGPLKFIHITRNPADTINSIVFRSRMAAAGADWWNYRSAIDGVRNWIRAWNFSIERGGQAGFLHLRYEDVCVDPGQAAATIAEFLGLPCAFDSSLAKPTPSPREVLTAADLRAVRRFLPAEILEWSSPLAILQDEFGQLEVPRRLHVRFERSRSLLQDRLRNGRYQRWFGVAGRPASD